MDGINDTVMSPTAKWFKNPTLLRNVILRRAQALRGTLGNAESGNAVTEIPQAASNGGIPRHDLEAFHLRKVPHAGFAAA